MSPYLGLHREGPEVAGHMELPEAPFWVWDGRDDPFGEIKKLWIFIGRSDIAVSSPFAGGGNEAPGKLRQLPEPI